MCGTRRDRIITALIPYDRGYVDTVAVTFLCELGARDPLGAVVEEEKLFWLRFFRFHIYAHKADILRLRIR